MVGLLIHIDAYMVQIKDDNWGLHGVTIILRNTHMHWMAPAATNIGWYSTGSL